jgi:hypothetical protein
MYSFKTSAEVPDDRHVTIVLPSDAPTGRADVVVVIDQENGTERSGNFRQFFGKIDSGNSNSADNEQIDADLARYYGNDED